MQKIIVSYIIIVFSSLTHAAIDPSKLLKVNKENNPSCVEYYNYQGDLYCSTTKLQANSPLSAQEITNYEKQHLVFDNRFWQAAWGKQTDAITTIEYVPAGDDIDQWQELITSQFIPSATQQLSPRQYLDLIIANFRQSGLDPKVTIHEQTPKQIIFEFQINTPKNLQQDEIQKVTQTDNGLYLLHYVTKKPDMGTENRQKWLNNIKASRV
ncbi:Uncharacterised protein [Legionella beliardensis]|uniref:Uncharacterized protein n=1 Tax=Legionella beliardensis TaxID=91822 RepID=A0A378I2H8_9GAMM|nr:hypothetical protein [Legionella beliardensis]STX29368.1 Uncharacterised protein [Legionella beliardensis]